jgi:hypothetical protein
MIPRCHKESCSVIKNPAVSLTSLDLIRWSYLQCRIGSRGVNDSAESASSVSAGIFYKNVQVRSRSVIDTGGSEPMVLLTPWDQIPQCQLRRWICYRCLIETKEFFTKMSKSAPLVYWHRRIWSRYIMDFFCIEFVCKSCAMLHNAGPWFRAMPHSAGSKLHSAGSKGQTLAPCCIA